MQGHVLFSLLKSQLLKYEQYAEALFTNRLCFLSEPVWQKVFVEPILSPSGLPSCSWDVHGILPDLCRLQKLPADCRAIIFHESYQTSDRIKRLLRKAEHVRSLFINHAIARQWDISKLSKVMSSKPKRYFFSHEDLVTENFCNHRQGMIILNRIVYTLDPSATAHEEDTKAFARETIDLHSAIEYHPERGPIHHVLSVQLRTLCSSVLMHGPEENLTHSVLQLVPPLQQHGRDFMISCAAERSVPQSLAEWQTYGHRFSRSGSIDIDDLSRGHNKAP